MRMAPEVTNFCKCLSLKHGTIIIGIVQSIMAFILLIITAAYADNPQELIDMAHPSVVPAAEKLREILITAAVINALLCIFSIMLIFGAETNRPLLLMPWLIIKPLFIGFYIIGTLVAFAHYGGAYHVGFIVGHLIIGTIICVFGAYKILTVYSLYKHLKKLHF